MMQKHVVVIGAGLGGLSAAISLASEGFSVDLIEKNDKVGGKLNIVTQDGFTFDLGPSILTMPQIFETLFERVGKKMADYVAIETVTPHWRNFYEDGSHFDLTPDPDAQKRELDRLDPNAYAELQSFMAYSKRISDEVEKGYFSKGLDDVWELVRFYGVFRSLTSFDIFRTMDQGVRKHVKNQKLVDALNYFIKYVGSSPYDAPALMNLLPHIQNEYGLWYVKGGMYGLALALEKLALELGVNIRLNSEVVEIERDNRLAKAVLLKDGTRIESDIIVSNMEVIPAMQKLLKSPADKLEKLSGFKPSCSGLVLHLGVDRQYPQLAHHNFFYSGNSRKHFDAVFHNHTLSEDPTIYLVAPVRSDPSQAPEGCDIIKALPHIPHIDPDKPLTEKDYSALRERVLVKLERMGLTDLRKHIVTEDYWTPADIESRYYSNLGSIYGVVADRNQNLGFKAPQRSLELANLYFVGGSVNPGGGMPMVTLSGQLVRDKILTDIKKSAG